MKPLLLLGALALTVCLVTGGDKTVSAPQEQRESSKRSTAGAGGGGADSNQPPPNLRANPADPIPFPETRPSTFAPAPFGTASRLGPMPDTLAPMGPPKPLPSLEAPTPVAPVDLPVRNVVEIPRPNQTVDSVNQTYTSTTTPFLEWIRSTRNAAEIARASREAIAQRELQEKMMRDAASSDLFLNIRFPYTGNQEPPPSGGAVIYSLPQR